MSYTDLDRESRPTATDAEAERAGTDLGPCLSYTVDVAGAWTIVTIAGEMDLMVTPLLRDLENAGAGHLVFDLRQVTFIDARGFGFLLTSQRDASQAGGCVRLVAPSRAVRRVLGITELDWRFCTFPSVDEATLTPVPGPWE